MHSLYKTAGKCTLNRSKVRYPNKREAQLALAVIKGRGNPKHTEKRAYHCPICNGWHLTSAETVNDTVLSGSVLQHTNPDAFDTGMKAFLSGSKRGKYSASKASLTRRVRHLLHLFAANDIPNDSWDNPWLWATETRRPNSFYPLRRKRSKWRATCSPKTRSRSFAWLKPGRKHKNYRIHRYRHGWPSH